MTLQSRFFKHLTWATLASLVALCMLASASAQSADTIDRTLNFGSIGLSKGHTIRVTGLAVGPCNIPAEIVLLDAEGVVVGATNLETMPERFQSFDLDFDSLRVRDLRVQLRVVVKYLVHAEHAADEQLVPTVEIIDNKTGKTTFGWNMPEMPEMPECPSF